MNTDIYLVESYMESLKGLNNVSKETAKFIFQGFYLEVMNALVEQGLFERKYAFLKECCFNEEYDEYIIDETCYNKAVTNGFLTNEENHKISSQRTDFEEFWVRVK